MIGPSQELFSLQESNTDPSVVQSVRQSLYWPTVSEYAKKTIRYNFREDSHRVRHGKQHCLSGPNRRHSATHLRTEADLVTETLLYFEISDDVESRNWAILPYAPYHRHQGRLRSNGTAMDINRFMNYAFWMLSLIASADRGQHDRNWKHGRFFYYRYDWIKTPLGEMLSEG